MTGYIGGGGGGGCGAHVGGCFSFYFLSQAQQHYSVTYKFSHASYSLHFTYSVIQDKEDEPMLMS